MLWMGNLKPKGGWGRDDEREVRDVGTILSFWEQVYLEVYSMVLPIISATFNTYN